MAAAEAARLRSASKGTPGRGSARRGGAMSASSPATRAVGASASPYPVEAQFFGVCPLGFIEDSALCVGWLLLHGRASVGGRPALPRSRARAVQWLPVLNAVDDYINDAVDAAEVQMEAVSGVVVVARSRDREWTVQVSR